MPGRPSFPSRRPVITSRRAHAAAAIAGALLAHLLAAPQPPPGGGGRGPAAGPSYLGLAPPGSTPAVFGPGLVSTGLAERDVAIAPDGREFYFSVTFRATSTIMVARRVGEGWTAPEVASFASDPSFLHMEPCLDPLGRRVFFLTNRPGPGEPRAPGWANSHIWAADRTADGAWGEPYDPGPPINDEGASFFPSMATDGTLYFTRSKPGTRPAAIYRARPAGRGFATPERLPDAVNGYGATFNGFIAPDQSFLVAGVEGRADARPPKAGNYYVFFREPDGMWTQGLNLGPAVNGDGNRVHSPYVSPDGRLFFFASSSPGDSGRTTLRGLTLRGLVDLAGRPGNGNSDIYWVDAAPLGSRRAF